MGYTLIKPPENRPANRFAHLIPKTSSAEQYTDAESGKPANGPWKRYRLISEGNRFEKFVPPAEGRTFLITAPNGKRYKVIGENAEGAQQALEHHLGGGPWEKYGQPQNTQLQRLERAFLKADDAAQQGDAQAREDAAAFAAEIKRLRAGGSDVERGALPSSEGPQESRIAEKGDMVPGSRARATGRESVLQGASLGAWDEIGSGIVAPIRAGINAITGEGPQGVSENYQQTRALSQAALARERELSPKTAMALELAGGLATGKVPAGSIARGGNVLTKAVRGAGVGAGYGALQGFNSGDGLDDRLSGAVEGAKVGATVGVVMPPIGRLVGKGYNALSSRFGSDIRRVANEAGTTPKVFRQVAKAYGDDAETGMLTKADNADMLLNSGPQLQAFAENIASQPGQGRSLLIRAIGQQSRGAGQRTADVVNRTVGRDAGRVTNANALEAERKAAGRLFEVARAHTGRFDVTGLRDNIINQIRETDGMVRAALVKARNLNVFKTETVGNASATQLHAARQAIDDQLTRPGVGSNAARLLRDVRSQIDETLKGNVPGMREADQAYSSVMRRKEALEAGREVFRRSYGSPEELAFEIRNMAPAERADFVRGARDSISEIMGTARNDAGAARRELLEKGWNREKLQLLIGKDTATVLANALDKEAARYNAAQNILGNSRTALRQEARKAFPGGDATPDYKGTSLYGAALQLGNKAFNIFVGNRRRALSLQAAQLLTRRAQDVEPLLQEAQRLARRRLNVREQIEIVGNALAVGMIAAQ